MLGRADFLYVADSKLVTPVSAHTQRGGCQAPHRRSLAPVTTPIAFTNDGGGTATFGVWLTGWTWTLPAA